MGSYWEHLAIWHHASGIPNGSRTTIPLAYGKNNRRLVFCGSAGTKLLRYIHESDKMNLVGGWAYPSEKYRSQLGLLFPIYFPWKFPQRNPTKLERFHQPTTWGCRLQVPIPYIRPNCLRPKFQGISPENMAKNMVNVYQKTMERSTMLFMAKSTNFLWQFSIAFCMFARG